MSPLWRTWLHAATILVLAAGWCLTDARAQTTAVLPPPSADETGMVPGDLILGHANTYPGHVGIYLGKWRRLPEPLRTTYNDVYDQILIRSQDIGLKYTYLAIDSDGGRGVRLVPLVEQFTDYLPKGARAVDLKGARRFEGGMGGAVAWPELANNDAKRWRIIEEALKAAHAKVPYEDSHMQLATTWLQSGTSYENMKLDCVSLVHVAYYRGAGISLDVSWMPWHDPGQLYAEAKAKNLFRPVIVYYLFVDAAVLGDWDLKLKVLRVGADHFEDVALPVRLLSDDKKVFVRILDPDKRAAFQYLPNVIEQPFRPTANDGVEVDFAAADGQGHLEIGADGGMSGWRKGMVQQGGAPGGYPFDAQITGTKRRFQAMRAQ